MRFEEVEKYQSDFGSGEAECQWRSVGRHANFQSDQSDAHGSSSDSDGDDSAMQNDVDETYFSDDSASHTPAQKSKR